MQRGNKLSGSIMQVNTVNNLNLIVFKKNEYQCLLMRHILHLSDVISIDKRLPQTVPKLGKFEQIQKVMINRGRIEWPSEYGKQLKLRRMHTYWMLAQGCNTVACRLGLVPMTPVFEAFTRMRPSYLSIYLSEGFQNQRKRNVFLPTIFFSSFLFPYHDVVTFPVFML